MMIKCIRSVFFAASFLAPMPANATTWCNLFDQIMLTLREHQFSCERKGSFDCVSSTPKVEIPGSVHCSILISAGLDGRIYYCKVSEPTEKLTSLWGQYVWSYFHFCASRNLLVTKGRIERETSQPLVAYQADSQLYTTTLEEDGTTFQMTMKPSN